MKTPALLLQSDAMRLPIADQSVHCVVTSPPYWGLRKYAGEQGQEPLGLEPTPERHIERTVEWAREVYRVLRDDGVFWLNYGDCYSAAGWESNRRSVVGAGSIPSDERKSGKEPGVPAGNLMLMPHRIALALQADGWIVRQDLVWAKPNPMPESVAGWRFQNGKQMVESALVGSAAIDTGDSRASLGDQPAVLAFRAGSWRHTRSHEYVFMLVKGMQYWSDQEAVREKLQTSEDENYPARAYSDGRGRQPGKAQHPSGPQRDASGGYPPGGSGRNPLSVLNIPTSPYKGAHYATFPPALIAPLIQATCPRWCCPVCGQGWAPAVELSYRSAMIAGPNAHEPDTWKGSKSRPRERRPDGTFLPRSDDARLGSPLDQGARSQVKRFGDGIDSRVLGYRPTCDHEHTQAEAVPGIVLDPFVGSGTTVMVARQLLRRGIGLDISRPYLREQATGRIGNVLPNPHDDMPLFNVLPPASPR